MLKLILLEPLAWIGDKEIDPLRAGEKIGLRKRNTTYYWILNRAEWKEIRDKNTLPKELQDWIQDASEVIVAVHSPEIHSSKYFKDAKGITRAEGVKKIAEVFNKVFGKIKDVTFEGIFIITGDPTLKAYLPDPTTTTNQDGVLKNVDILTGSELSPYCEVPRYWWGEFITNLRHLTYKRVFKNSSAFIYYLSTLVIHFEPKTIYSKVIGQYFHDLLGKTYFSVVFKNFLKLAYYYKQDNRKGIEESIKKIEDNFYEWNKWWTPAMYIMPATDQEKDAIRYGMLMGLVLKELTDITNESNNKYHNSDEYMAVFGNVKLFQEYMAAKKLTDVIDYLYLGIPEEVIKKLQNSTELSMLWRYTMLVKGVQLVSEEEQQATSDREIQKYLNILKSLLKCVWFFIRCKWSEYCKPLQDPSITHCLESIGKVLENIGFNPDNKDQDFHSLLKKQVLDVLESRTIKENSDEGNAGDR